MWMMIGMLLLNSVISFIFLLFTKGEKRWLALFFLFFPALGFLLYGSLKLIHKFLKQVDYDKESLIKRVKVEWIKERPAIEQELNIIPMEDIKVIKNTKEKRNLLLNQLKKNIQTHYRHLLPVSHDEDSETAHYIAAAKMEVYRGLQKRLQNSFKEYGKNQDTYLEQLLESMIEYIESDLLSNNEAIFYKKKYCALVGNKESELLSLYIQKQIVYLIDLKEYVKAEVIWQTFNNQVQNQEVYMKMLEMYLEQKEQSKFYNCIEQLNCSSHIELSSETMEMIRYWIRRRA